MFDKVLVANRGEIAVRIFRTLRDMGLASVAVYSDADRDALHPRFADEAFALGGATSAESYLVVEKLLEAARAIGRRRGASRATASSPRTPAFARAVEEAGLVWIGPPPAAIELMGSKTRARQAMQAAGVPIIPGTTDPVGSADEVVALGEQIGYPLLIKAAAGGGGKGMKIVWSADEAARAFESAQREGQSYFADASVYVEKYLEDPRHVEVQVLADAHGNVVHLGERDCTIQRRHQKLVEETPSPAVGPELRDAHRPDRGRRGARGGVPLGRDDRRAARARRLVLLHGDEHAHPGRAHGHGARHRPRSRPRADAGRARRAARLRAGRRPARTGHAIECRINAEDAANGFLPSPGTITLYREPARAGRARRLGRRAGLGRSRRSTTRWSRS